MKMNLTNDLVKQLCGRLSYERGTAYFRSGKTVLTVYDPETPLYEGTVLGGKTEYRASVRIGPNGRWAAECTCPSLGSYDLFCSHAAAVLLSALDVRKAEKTPASQPEPEERLSCEPERLESELSERVLRLFGPGGGLKEPVLRLFDEREVLGLEWTLSPVPSGNRGYLFGIAMKLGRNRLYPVSKIREFLDLAGRGEAVELNRHFVYDPGIHVFAPEDEAVLRELIRIRENEWLYREASGLFGPAARGQAAERTLLLRSPSVRTEHDGEAYDRLERSDEPLPVRFEFDQATGGGFGLQIEGLERVTAMEAYGCILQGGKLRAASPEVCRRVAELKRWVADAGVRRIPIRADEAEAYVERVLPGLMELGSVNVSPSVADKMVRTPLQAKLYLDRVKDRLLAGLEFRYGDIVIDPSEASGRRRAESRILVRDGEKERAILALMDQSFVAKTEGGYLIDGEDNEYEFLTQVVPRLEKLLRIYATSAVKERLHPGPVHPRVTVEVDERTDWLELSFDIDGIPDSAVRNVLRSLADKRKYYRLPNGALLPLENERFREIVRLLNEFGIRGKELTGSSLRLPAVRGLLLTDTGDRGSAVVLGKSLRKLIESLRNPDHSEFPVPERLHAELRDYQKYGFQWMKTLARYGFGGILADDMGLGKTVQSIAYLLSALPDIRAEGRPALVVCPASLLYNWRNELGRFAPDIRAIVADGERERRVSLLTRLDADVIITSYPLLRRDLDLYGKTEFHTILLDEAQTIKNHATQTARAAKAIRSSYRFALTGTPVENSLDDLRSIFEAVFPGLLPGRKEFAELPREAVAKRIRPFVLRRLKADVLRELPEKIETLQASELLPEQKKLYVAHLAKLQQETLKHLSVDGWKRHKMRIIAGLTRLRQLCCHPALFVEGYDGSSGKFEQLLELVEECRSAGKRMLVFSQFTEMLGLIRRELGYRGVSFFYLDGQTSASERIELSARFNEGEREAFLVSLKAGGTGLNLTGADTVILYDLWWNPAVEQQAADRAHRIGQKKVVQVIRLVAQGTVEDKMYELQRRKSNLLDEVVQAGSESLSALSEQDVRELLSLDGS
ncbi:DEAD/DEAH box helicase [Cohnella xylanilytica]|uniref:DEAD/DEAH box helicase n=1 Tax=Cohnella xylanilytica TaxID=557555 RepID=A0A841U7F2_9BACL|nr:DEAD/DEAH box helicase [Cohnella xylanilytica]MBB6695592.1 DEAD/DEAH box helicase [Cohnella xylanilytica]